MNLESSDKDVLFAEMTECLVRSNPALDRKSVLKALEERESKKNTCIFPKIGVPHANCKGLTAPLIAIGVSKKGIDYDLPVSERADYRESLVHLVVLILFEQGNTERHLKLLADCARVLMLPGFYNAIMKAKTPADLISVIREFEIEQ